MRKDRESGFAGGCEPGKIDAKRVGFATNLPELPVDRQFWEKFLKTRLATHQRPVDCTLQRQEVPQMRSTELLDCKSLEPGSLIDVETTSRHYRIECLGGSAIRISGHPQFCPTPVVAQLEGSVTNQGTIESGIIERGMRLVVLFDDRIPVTTSRVLHVHLDHTNN
jgi:hypothetical protein